MNRKLGRKKDNRQLLIRNLATSLILFERIETTEAKAREAKSFLDRLLAKNRGGLNSYRNLSKVLLDGNAVKKVVNELAPRYESRQSGFIRSYHLKNRLGDNAPMMRLELVDSKVFVDKSQTKNKAASEDGAKDKESVKVRTKVAKK